MRMLNRREVLGQVTAVVAGAAVGSVRSAHAKGNSAESPRFFPGFRSLKLDGDGAVINGVIGGQGPPLLLLHGAPQTHVVWNLVAPKLAAEYTVVATDLRGYGDSSIPPDGDNHEGYSKRATAND